MAFKEGNKVSKGRGRPKGVGNKATSIVKETIGAILSDNVHELERRMNNLNDRDFINAYTKLASYVIPTLKAQEVKQTVTVGEPEWLQKLDAYSEEEITALMKENQ